ncbi:MAG: hypothetical protein OK439_03195 [Thaumarchaeota archaeon]|nr:hypothetical protein [Nitrososphaerota archaeon]
MSNEFEMILAQEQSVVRKSDAGEKIQGTLVLTDKRLLFISADKEEELDMQFGDGLSRRSGILRFADVEDLNHIPNSPKNLSIPMNSIVFVSGSEGIIHPPSLKVNWNENGKGRHVEFSEEIIGGRKKDLRDWAKVIDSLRSGKMQIHRPQNPIPSKDTLEGKILQILGDMQDKGVFTIEEEVETTFGIDLDPDQVESACQKLVSDGLVDVIPDPSGDKFFRKRSPLGEDDLSS